ncbi:MULTISPECIES: DUF4335 domain-containing protein [Cyanophyceae]|uniref:DUF4335 domain-containing protein n=1 Tax=Cyanophyceae TaxID=3028117 RepID=UPI0023308BC8|nr:MULTISPECIES: DUF4335 domain-containing protein [Cyanophyceae]MDB9355689.1 DUF4335 domain-containing protein [Nodularia spumigena CS-587/03]MDB9338598.1 DUF4335 domain-containing protein [Nodularia spumigena CS-589/07]MDB9349246.1 DUF4335 domain-containing protein [Nodularia spumigena CS-588/01]MDB9352052.1 DUF4335 domain-containing protein [Nodularia spumigena CS-588/05]MDB9399795.1 DUF4335 domain-containing protein [Microcystis aeruginosa CS-567/02-A1]
MPPLNSVIRRYTPPTCTLEILAQSSPLSHWMGKTVIKQLTFELHFDDPQLPEEGRITIRGDRDQLEILCDVVTSYVQEFLQQPPDNFWTNLSEPEDSSKVSQDSEFIDFQQTSLPSAKTFKSFTSQTSQSKIYLEPGNYLTHNLFIGSLANQTSGSVIPLSLLQLFDLATALDEYSADLMALPNLNQNHKVLRLPAWAPIAAVMVLGVGLLPATWHFANNNKQNQPEIATTSQPEEVKTALEPSPSLEPPTSPPAFTPPDDLQPPQPFDSNSQLPTASFPQQPQTAPNSSLFPNSSSSLPSAQDPLLIFESKIPNIESNRRSSASTIIPQQEIAVQPNSIGSITQIESGLTQRRTLPPRLSADRETLPSISSVPLTVSTNPNNNLRQTSSPSDSLLNRQQIEQTINSSVNVASEANNNDSFVARSTSQPVNPTPEEFTTRRTLFDTPQVAEAREIFTKRWQPATGFTQTLEYSLIVSIDGTIERIYPLNQAARTFIDSAGMPEIGQPFVSANKNGENVRIRVVLSPDGKVQTFPENE